MDAVEYKLVRNTLVVKVKGDLDMLIAEKLRQEIDERLQDDRIKNLILNLESVQFIDSSGLGVIIGRYKQVKSKNGRMYIIGAKKPVEKILFFSGINKLVPIYNNEQDIMDI
ncbi:Anti-sigma F factor antagonist [Candidatus Syntrophocurvum alkaliphilum]|uniref:Anti-sigma F factor antagonist n=1 Tax=Candidatus Syntrophocurvum alkaliphilum TaxID=2293317 RepID=A0A6I6DC33_9FIRM|nr:anti-sigma F factor antagonist [Candidatus Syntrophocurvum alkaliphilum]QGT98994.1 Anti-sigma F factor antagonist [Candidatus Syntrophocurvum alkaliphilum]